VAATCVAATPICDEINFEKSVIRIRTNSEHRG
jgi:hypothetical protein